MINIKKIVKERWKFYLVGFIVGYFIPILTYGVPSWKYLFPIRYLTVGMTIGIGNSLYVGATKFTNTNAFVNAVKSVAIVLCFWLLLYLIRLIILKTLSFDISPLINMSP
jgi:uncharacterized membrane protein